MKLGLVWLTALLRPGDCKAAGQRGGADPDGRVGPRALASHAAHAAGRGRGDAGAVPAGGGARMGRRRGGAASSFGGS